VIEAFLYDDFSPSHAYTSGTAIVETRLGSCSDNAHAKVFAKIRVTLQKKGATEAAPPEASLCG
jgi:hypothetical protein